MIEDAEVKDAESDRQDHEILETEDEGKSQKSWQTYSRFLIVLITSLRNSNVSNCGIVRNVSLEVSLKLRNT